MVVYQCSDSFDGILCGVYDAWMSRLGHDNVRLALADTGNLEMFVEYRTVEETKEKLEKVIGAIRQKIGLEVYRQIYQDKCQRDYKNSALNQHIITVVNGAHHQGTHAGPGKHVFRQDGACKTGCQLKAQDCDDGRKGTL